MFRRAFLQLLASLPFVSRQRRYIDIRQRPTSVKVFRGIKSHAWDDPDNWEGGQVPTSSDTIYIENSIDMPICFGNKLLVNNRRVTRS